MSYSIVNCIVTAQCAHTCDLEKYAYILKAGLFRPTKFSAYTIKCVNPKGSVMIFTTGKITVMGCKSFEEAHIILFRLQKRLRLVFDTIRCSNLVASCQVSTTNININSLQEKYTDCIVYNPELFPGCTYQPDPNGTIRVNIFQSGKIVVTGCTNHKDIQSTIEQTRRLIYSI